MHSTKYIRLATKPMRATDPSVAAYALLGSFSLRKQNILSNEHDLKSGRQIIFPVYKYFVSLFSA